MGTRSERAPSLPMDRMTDSFRETIGHESSRTDTLLIGIGSPIIIHHPSLRIIYISRAKISYRNFDEHNGIKTPRSIRATANNLQRFGTRGESNRNGME